MDAAEAFLGLVTGWFAGHHWPKGTPGVELIKVVYDDKRVTENGNTVEKCLIESLGSEKLLAQAEGKLLFVRIANDCKAQLERSIENRASVDCVGHPGGMTDQKFSFRVAPGEEAFMVCTPRKADLTVRVNRVVPSPTPPEQMPMVNMRASEIALDDVPR